MPESRCLLRSRGRLLAVLVALPFSLSAVSIQLHAQPVSFLEVVSVAPDGTVGDDSSGQPQISGDEQHVAFESEVTNLVDGDTTGERDVFVRDLSTDDATTTRVSGSSAGRLRID